VQVPAQSPRQFRGLGTYLGREQNLDNLKAAVLKADWADPQLNPKLIDFARHYGTTILPCLPRVPEHKGKVESSVKYVKNNALAGRKFATLAEVNQFLLHWEKTVADRRIHGTTKCQVAERFQWEKPFLTPLPASLFPCFQEGPRTVHRDGHVEVAKAYYHVPPEQKRLGSNLTKAIGKAIGVKSKHFYNLGLVRYRLRAARMPDSLAVGRA